ncbi:hypothetical protein K0U00_48915, partial [Paenibacillus sepulcri]|nr:hypothetical protein [Paenibacillus sepulcri]
TTSAVIEMLQAMKQEGTTMVGIFHDWDVMEQVADDILDISRSAGDDAVPDAVTAAAGAE